MSDAATGPDSPIDIALIVAGRSYNEEDFAPLAAEPDVSFRVLRFASDWGQPDVVILPGTTDVAADFDMLEAGGVLDALRAHVAKGGWVAGICGGLQMMGRRLLDPHHHKYPFDQKAMLGLLNVDTVFAAEPVFKRLRNVSAPGGFLLRGFETHRGMSDGDEPVLFRRDDGSAIGFGHGRLWATYLHRCFDDAGFRRYFIDAVRQQRDRL